jgi:hypothetical protein
MFALATAFRILASESVVALSLHLPNGDEQVESFLRPAQASGLEQAFGALKDIRAALGPP